MGSLAVALAVLATAFGGGSYKGSIDGAEACGDGCFAFLVVADDGRSLTADSVVAAPCMPGGGSTVLSDSAPRGTPIRADGSFGWHGPYQVVEGRFAADGRSVRGTARYLADPRHNCATAPVTFAARLVRRTKPDGTCEPLRKSLLDVSAFVRRTGCTEATRVVDAWRSDRDCVTISLGAGRAAPPGGAARRCLAAGCSVSPASPAARGGRRSSS